MHFSLLFPPAPATKQIHTPDALVARRARYRLIFDLGRAFGARGFEKGGGGRSLIVEILSMKSGKVLAIGLGGSSET